MKESRPLRQLIPQMRTSFSAIIRAVKSTWNQAKDELDRREQKQKQELLQILHRKRKRKLRESQQEMKSTSDSAQARSVKRRLFNEQEAQHRDVLEHIRDQSHSRSAENHEDTRLHETPKKAMNVHQAETTINRMRREVPQSLSPRQQRDERNVQSASGIDQQGLSRDGRRTNEIDEGQARAVNDYAVSTSPGSITIYADATDSSSRAEKDRLNSSRAQKARNKDAFDDSSQNLSAEKILLHLLSKDEMIQNLHEQLTERESLIKRLENKLSFYEDGQHLSDDYQHVNDAQYANNDQYIDDMQHTDNGQFFNHDQHARNQDLPEAAENYDESVDQNSGFERIRSFKQADKEENKQRHLIIQKAQINLQPNESIGKENCSDGVHQTDSFRVNNDETNKNTDPMSNSQHLGVLRSAQWLTTLDTPYEDTNYDMVDNTVAGNSISAIETNRKEGITVEEILYNNKANTNTNLTLLESSDLGENDDRLSIHLDAQESSMLECLTPVVYPQNAL